MAFLPNPLTNNPAAPEDPNSLAALDPLAIAGGATNTLASPSVTTPEPPPARPRGVLTDILGAPFRGIEGAAKSLYKLADFLTFDSLPNWNKRFLGESETAPGQLVEKTAQFLAGFIPAFTGIGAAAELGEVATGALAGGVADFTVFDGQESRLSNLVQSVPTLQNPVTEFLAAKEGDNELVGRIKNTLEGAGVGGLTEGLMKGLRGLRAARAARAEGKAAEEVNKALASAFEGGQEEVQKTLQDGLPKPDPEPAAPGQPRQEIKEMARHPAESGRFNPDLIESPGEARQLITYRAKAILEAEGPPSPQNLEAIVGKTAAVMEEHLGLPRAAILNDLRQSMEESNLGIFKARAAAEYMVATAQHTQELLRKAAVSRSAEDQANVVTALERLGEFIRINGGFGTVQGRALQARKFIKRGELRSAEIVRQILDEAGGQDYLATQIEKLNLADSAGNLTKQVVAQVSKSNRLLRAHNEYWINAILSGPKTHIANALGNATVTAWLPIERFIGAIPKWDTEVMQSAAKQFNYFGQAVGDSLSFAAKAFREERNILDASGRIASEQGVDRALSSENLGHVFDSLKTGTTLGNAANFIGKMINLPSRFLMAGDEFFKQLNYRAGSMTKLYHTALTKYGLRGKAADEWVDQTYKGLIRDSGERYSEAAIYREAIKKSEDQGLTGPAQDVFVDDYVKKHFDPTQGVLKDMFDASEFGNLAARQATFTEELGPFGKWLQAGAKRNPWMHIIIPFVRTPINIVKFVGRRTFPLVKIPLTDKDMPLLSSVFKRHMADLNSGDPLRIAEANGRFATGMLMFAGAAMAVSKGVVTGGGPQDEEQRKILEATGWQPYSINLGGERISYRRLDPIAGFIGFVADWFEVAQRDEDHLTEPLKATMVSLATALTRNITNKTYLAGLTQVIDAISNPERYADRLAKKQVASYVPNLLTQAKVALGDDQVMREYNTYWEAIKSRLPGASKTLEPKRNLLGEPVDALIASTPLLGPRADWVSPIAISKDRNDPVFSELARLAHGFQNPSPLVFRDLNMLEFASQKGQTAYDRWLQLHGEVQVGGRTLRDSLAQLINSRGYQKLSDVPEEPGYPNPRVSEIQRIVNIYRRAALNQVRHEYPELSQAMTQHTIVAAARRSGQTVEQINALLAAYSLNK